VHATIRIWLYWYYNTDTSPKEIETSKQKLAASMRNNHNLQEELSEVYRIKSQLADLHKSELEKDGRNHSRLLGTKETLL